MVLDKGNIVELGPHEELMKIKDGKYRQLYDMQFSEEEAA
jgi:ABC-type multidrug transport system fused ATPase/permease subunit